MRDKSHPALHRHSPLFQLISPFAFWRIMIWILAFLSFFPILFVAPTAAQLRMVSVSPEFDDLHTSAVHEIRVTFDRALNENTLPPGAIQVWGNFHGQYDGTISYASSTSTLIFTPMQSFVDGEEITVMVKSSIRGGDGSTLAQSLTWRFLVRTNYGTAVFTPVVIDLENLTPAGGLSQEPTHLIAADFDNDDFIDLAVVHHGSNRITVLRNTVLATLGATLFTPSAILSTGNTPTRAAAADFNGDRFLDLAAVNFNDNTLQIFSGNGAGQFSAPQTYTTGEHPIHLLAQDFNGDGAIDVAVVTLGIDRVGIFLNDGNGAFTETQRLPVGAAPIAATAWDYNQDGDLDLAVANNGAKSLSLLRNDARGNFTVAETLTLPLPPVDLLSGDVIGARGNQVGDGRRELIVLCSELHFLGKSSIPENPANLQNASLLAIVNWNATRLNLTETVPLAGYAQAFTLCNVDTLDTQRGAAALRPDRDLDLFYTRFWDGVVSWLRNPDNQSFHNAAAANLDSVQSAKAIAYFDVDRDGDNDLVVSNFLQNQLVVYLNQGQRIPPCTPLDSLGTSVAVLDFGEVWVRRTGARRLLVNNSSSLDFSYTTALTDSVHFGVSPRQGVLPAGQVFPLRATFTPEDTLFYRANLLISTNDYLANSAACPVILQGRGVRATIVADSLLDFGCAPPGRTIIRSLRIQNTGNISLVLYSATTSTANFALRQNVISRQIPPHALIDVPIAFTPNRLGIFLDSLKISSNDLDTPIATVYLRGCGSRNAPTITSSDTLYATEDVLAIYVATATDPDGTTPAFRFENLPHWLQAFSDTVRGTPREGDLDTSFIVIASDGFLEDTLQVIVIVTPVNDPPFFDPIADRTVFERDLLVIDVLAHDPEDSVIALFAQNLPAGANFVDLGGGRGRFSWWPDFGTAGDYLVTFIVSEQIAIAPLTGTATVKITVLARQPDLYVVSLSAPQNGIRLNQIVTARAVFADSAAPASRPFRAALFLDNQLVADTVITSMEPGATVIFVRPVQFNSLGRHVLQAVIDADNVISEPNETNNALRLEIEVELGDLLVAPNPFTPNADGFNDAVIFDLRNLSLQSPQLKIFDLKGNLLTTFSEPQAMEFRWDGNDRNGRPQAPGLYLYLLLEGDKKMASGYVVLAR
jgi:gliding motility-associated-like protein